MNAVLRSSSYMYSGLVVFVHFVDLLDCCNVNFAASTA